MFLINRFTCNFKTLPKVINNLKSNKMHPIIDLVNERYKKDNINNMNKLMTTYPNNLFALKLSSIGLNQLTDKQVTENTLSIIENAIINNNKILIDAENYILQDKINDITDLMIENFNKNKVNVFKTYQLYRKDHYNLLYNDLNKFKYHGIKLVRGAYLNQDKKYNILHNNKKFVDNDFNKAIKLYFDNNNLNNKLIVATHNQDSINLAIKLQNQSNYNIDNISFAQLLGMSNSLSKNLAKEDKSVFKYIPVGNFNESLPYLVRRLYENISVLKYLSK